MGIPYYFYHICKKYKEGKINIKLEELAEVGVECLYFDYNSLIHPCVAEVLSALESEDEVEGEIIKFCLVYTRFIINIIKPSKAVYIAVDGVAPRAKMNQQRERRYKSVYFKEVESKKTIFDTNMITPGTEFMRKLGGGLRKFGEEVGVEMGIKVVVSDAEESGEGEHKLMRYLKESGYEKNCIYGLDADLIMLSVLNVEGREIYLFRDSKNKRGETEYTCVNTVVLKKYIEEELKYGLEGVVGGSRLIEDYVFLCYFLGNDFLPGLWNLSIRGSGVDILIRSYKTAVKKLGRCGLVEVKSGSIRLDLELLYVILRTVLEYSRTNFKEVKTFRSDEEVRGFEEREGVSFLLGREICPKFNRVSYYQYLGVMEKSIGMVVNDYLRGTLWTYGYYSDHSHRNWNWYYKNDGSPLLEDIVWYIEREMKEKGGVMTCRFEEDKALCSKMQLLLVLPRESLERCICSSSILMRYLRDQKVKEYYPDKIIIDCVNREYLWQSKPFLKDIPETLLVLMESCL